MKQFEKIPARPLRPTVTLEEFLAFDPARPETRTSSPQVNAVAEAIWTLPRKRCEDIAAHLCVSEKQLSDAMAIITGHELSQLRYHWIDQQYQRLTAENPRLSRTDLARLLGFADSAALYHCLRSPGFKNKRRVNIRTPYDWERKEMREMEEYVKRIGK